jgi:hypothetical protein
MTDKKTIIALENPPRDFFPDQRTYAYFLTLVTKINEIITSVNNLPPILLGVREEQQQLIRGYKTINDSVQKIRPYQGTKYANEREEKQAESDEMYQRYIYEKEKALKQGQDAYNQFLEENKFTDYF